MLHTIDSQDSCGQMNCDQSKLITLLGSNCLFKTFIVNSTCETINSRIYFVKYVNHKLCIINTYLFSGGSRNFKPGGAVEFLGSRDCFYVPLHIPYVFVARVLKRLYYKLYKHCMLTSIKIYAYYTVKIAKNKLKK